MEPIKIQELCRRFGVSSRTLRHWEDQGLLSSVRVGSGAIRAFDAAECERLEKILFLKRLDLPLGVIRSILTDGADVGAILREQRVYLASRAAEMRKRIVLLEKVLVCIDADKDILIPHFFGMIGQLPSMKPIFRWQSCASTLFCVRILKRRIIISESVLHPICRPVFCGTHGMSMWIR